MPQGPERGLANLRPWKPGQSGNPKGRPPYKGVAARLRLLLEKDSQVAEAVQVLQDLGEDVESWDIQPLTYGDLVARRLVDLAIRGKMEAIALVMAYADGKPGDKQLQAGQSDSARPRISVEDFQRAMGLRRDQEPGDSDQSQDSPVAPEPESAPPKNPPGSVVSVSPDEILDPE